MPARARPPTIGIGMLAGMALAACSGGARDPVLILEGSYTGTTSSSCQMALRAADGSLVDSHEVEPNFRQEFAVATGKGSYHAEIHCPDGKVANTPDFDFEPPRAKITFGQIVLY